MLTDEWKKENCLLCADGIQFVLDERPGIVSRFHVPSPEDAGSPARECTATVERYVGQLETELHLTLYGWSMQAINLTYERDVLLSQNACLNRRIMELQGEQAA